MRSAGHSCYNTCVLTDQNISGQEEQPMKLMIAIVQDEDAGKLIGELMDQNFGVTKKRQRDLSKVTSLAHART